MTAPRRPIGDFMTLLPHTIRVDQPLSAAQALMSQLEVRHLPVVEDHTLLGVLSDRDLALAMSLGADLTATAVGLAMTPGPLVVGPDAELSEVVREMATQKFGSVLIQEGGRVVGILTTVDALALLAELLGAHVSIVPSNRWPSEVSQRIRHEHRAIEALLGEVEQLAERVLHEDTEAEAQLVVRATELYDALLAHMELEDKVLAPSLREAPIAGDYRADELLTKHREQREQLQMGKAMLESGDVEHLSQSLLLLAHWVRVDMRHEEATLLTDGALSDNVVLSDASAG